MDIIIKESGVAKPLVYMDTATGTENAPWTSSR